MLKMNISLITLLLSLNSYSGHKIVGGTLVKKFEEASFIVKFTAGCAGSIIDKKWILTAAHCESIFNYGMTAGSLDANHKKLEIELEKSFVHPEYNPSTINNDFALIKLKNEIDIEKYNIEPIAIADEAFERSGRQDPTVVTTVYGWGKTSEDEGMSRFLRKVWVPIVSSDVANDPDSYNGMITENMIAAGLKEGGKDACQGDSGGPMTTIGYQGEQVLIGVVSWGIGCARELKYGVYSKVSRGYDWIIKTMEENQ